MNRSSFNLKSTLLAASALLAIAFAAPASATCYGYGCGTPTPAPAPTPTSFNISAFAGAAFEGSATGSYSGWQGGVDAFKEGYGESATVVNFGGTACGLNCGNVTYAGSAAARERVGVTAWAIGNHVNLQNSGTALTQATGGVTFTKIPGTP